MMHFGGLFLLQNTLTKTRLILTDRFIYLCHKMQTKKTFSKQQEKKICCKMQICSVQTTITWLIVHMCYAGMICATAAGEQAKYTMKKVSSGTENPKLIWVKKHAFAFIQRVWCDNWLVSNAATQPWQWKRAVATANNNLFRCCCFFFAFIFRLCSFGNYFCVVCYLIWFLIFMWKNLQT